MEGKEKRSEVKRTQGDYNLGFKLEVVSEVETGEMTYKQAQRKYGIQGRSTVLVWLRKHGRLDWKRNATMTEKAKPSERIRELERKLRRLKQEKEILNRAIDLADKELKTDIRKKYLALLSEASKQQGSNDSEEKKDTA
jgi:transposase-like protein